MRILEFNQPVKIIMISLAVLLWLLLIIPVFALVWRALSFDFTLQFDRLAVLESVWLSIRTSLISLVIIFLTGTPMAYILVNYDFPLKSLLSLFIEMPIVMPPVIAGLALLATFGRAAVFGPVLNWLGLTIPFTTSAVVLAQVFVSAPFYIRGAQSGFGAVNREIQEAAEVDGADRWRVFWQIIFPISMNSLFAGMMLSWARALGEFGATILFAGNLTGTTQTMPLLIYSKLESDLAGAFLTALILLGLAFGAFALARTANQKFGLFLDYND